MNRLVMALFSLPFIGIGGYQALFPGRLIEHNMNQPMNWTPEWMKRRAHSAPSVWSTRIAGIIACIVGLVMLTKAAFGL